MVVTSETSPASVIPQPGPEDSEEMEPIERGRERDGGRREGERERESTSQRVLFRRKVCLSQTRHILPQPLFSCQLGASTKR